MKKKWLTFVAAATLLGCMTSCEGGGNNSSASVPPKTLEEMLQEYANVNVTYHSDYQIYYYPTGKVEEKKVMSYFDIETKFSASEYESKAYLYSNDKKELQISLHYEKDEEGYAVERYVDKNNQVQTERLSDNLGEIPWNESVYCNQLSSLAPSDFTIVGTDTYQFSGDLNGAPFVILHGAMPVGEFEIESFVVKTKENHIDEIVIQEKETDKVYENHMYGRILSIRFENLGTTEIAKIEAFPEKEENNPLGNALEEMRNASSFTTQYVVVDGNQEGLLKETKVTETDAVTTVQTETGPMLSGVHTDNGALYSFLQNGDALNGTLTEKAMEEYRPQFDFSKNIFTFVEEVNGVRSYEISSSYAEILNDIDFDSEYSEDYAGTGKNITFHVKDNHLVDVVFPTIVQGDNGQAKLVDLYVKYSNLNQTTIDPTTWDTFVIQEASDLLSWDNEDVFLFSFFYSEDPEDYEEMTIGMVFGITLEDSSVIPAFLPSNGSYMVDGEYSAEDGKAHIFIEMEVPSVDETLESINIILIEAGFTYDNSKIEEGEEVYTLGEISIVVVNMGDFMAVEFILPPGEMAA